MQNTYETPVCGVCCRIAGILRELRTAMPHTHIVLQALLPRGMTQLPLLRFRWPNRSTVALAAVNSRLKVRLTAVFYVWNGTIPTACDACLVAGLAEPPQHLHWL